MKQKTDLQNHRECLNIAMLGHKRVPSREGGVEVVVTELSTRMVKLGHSVCCFNRKGHHVAGREHDEFIKSYSSYKGVKLKTVVTLNMKGLAAVSSSFFAAIKSAFSNYQIVHFHAEGSCVMIWIPKLLGKRCIVTIHGLDWQRAKWKNGLGEKYIKLGEKAAVRYADEIIVLSKNIQEYFKASYGRTTRFIPNGITSPEHKPAVAIHNQYGLEQESYLCYLGRLTEEKGLEYLIQAYRSVKTEKKLVIAGGSSDSEHFVEHLKSLASGDSRILFTGFVQGQLLEELYSNAYFYILPSDIEGMPLSLLEAMSYGNCCLVSNIDEMTEVVEDKAVIFEKSNIKDLAEKLQQLCDHPDMVHSYKAYAKNFICKKYNWDDVVKQTISVYKG